MLVTALLVPSKTSNIISSNQHKPAWTNIKFMLVHAGFFMCEQGKQKRTESYPVCEIIALVFFGLRLL